jgi:hypothetical protein
LQATLMFNQQGSYYNAVTMGNSTNTVVAALANLAAANMNGITASAFVAGINNPGACSARLAASTMALARDRGT